METAQANNTSTVNTATTEQTQQQSSGKPEFGTGRYSALMQECYDDSQVIFGLPADKAEKLSRRIASEVGAIMQSGVVGIKTGKVSKDGKITISEASKVKGVTMTNTLLSLKALHYAAEAGANGFMWSTTKWNPCNPLKEFFASL